MGKTVLDADPGVSVKVQFGQSEDAATSVVEGRASVAVELQKELEEMATEVLVGLIERSEVLDDNGRTVVIMMIEDVVRDPCVMVEVEVIVTVVQGPVVVVSIVDI